MNTALGEVVDRVNSHADQHNPGGADPLTLRTGIRRVGVSRPDGWDTGWRAALAQAGSRPVVISIPGDSLSAGYYASNLRTTSWPGRLATSLQTLYGDGGSGVHNPLLNTAIQGHSYYDGVPGSYVTLAGSWGRADGIQPGPSGYGILGTFDGSSATVTTARVRGTTVRIYTNRSAGSASFTYTIDGGSPATGTTGPGIAVTSVTGLTAGNHTVVVSAANGAGFGLLGVRGENTTGVRVDNSSIPGETAAAWSTDLTAADWMGGVNWPCDLLIYTLAGNDMLASSTAWAAYMNDAQRYLTRVRAGSPGCSILITSPGVPDTATFTDWYLWDMATRSLAEGFGAAHVNFMGLTGNVWTAWRDASRAGNASDPTTSGTDNVHWSDAGHQWASDQLLSVLLGT